MFSINMTKCKIVFKNMNNITSLIMDKERNICLLNNKYKDINIQSLLDDIERIISSWEDKNEENKLVLDGSSLEIHYLNNNDDLIHLKYNDLSMPKNAIKLYSIMEALNEQ